MKIVVKLFAQYRNNRFKEKEFEIKEGTTAENIMAEVGILNDPLPLGVLMINSRHQETNTILQDGDVVSFFPKVGGG